jgi:hypothetical protein
MVVKEGLLASLRVRNPDFDANTMDPDEVPPHCEFFEKDEGLIFTGLAGMFLVWAKQRKYSVELEGWPCDPVEGWTTTLPEVDPNILPDIVLKPHQVDAIRKALKYGRGILEIATGGGKTEVAIALTRILGTPRTLFLVPDCSAMHQMYQRCLKRGFSEGEVGRLGDALYEMDRTVIIAVINSAYSGIKTKDPVILEFLETCELFIADEVHHQATAITWQIVATQCKAERRFGLSGTPYKDAASRFNPHYIHPYDSFLTGLLGPTLVYVPPERLQEMGELAPCTVVSFPAGGEEVRTGAILNSWMAKNVWRKAYKLGIVENEDRNKRICLLAANISEMGGFPLVSVEALEHGRNIQRTLWEEYGIPSVCSYGSAARFIPKAIAEQLNLPFEEIPVYDKPPTLKNKKAKKPSKQVGVEEGYVQISGRVDIFWHIQRGDLKVLIGSRIYDEAMDVPFLSDLINAAGGKAEQRFRQKVGRVLRRADGKGVARIWEPWDTCHSILMKHSSSRLDSASGQGWPVHSAQELLLDWMYDIRASQLALGEKVTMRETEIEICVSLTVPVNTGDPTDRFCCIKPSVSVRAELEKGDSLDECMKKLSTRVKAHFMMEASRQAQTLGEFKRKGFVEATKDYLKSLEAGAGA